MALSETDVQHIMDDHWSELLELIRPDSLLFAELRKRRVLPHHVCMAHKDAAKTLEYILDVIRGGTVKQFTTFVESLRVSHQEAAASLLQSAIDSSHQYTPCISIWSAKDEVLPSNCEPLTFNELLSTTDVGEVWRGTWNSQKQTCINSFENIGRYKQSILQEFNAVLPLEHKNLVKFIALCSQGVKIHIVTEFVQHGSLLSYLHERDEKHFTLNDLIDMAIQIANGMAYLEQFNFIHSSLKLQNVLLGVNNVVKVVMKIHKNIEHLNTGRGSHDSIRWTSPEGFLKNAYSTKSDVWSYGVLLYELFTFGDFPYSGLTDREVIEYVENGYRLTRPLCSTDEIYDLMLSCWNPDPLKRPAFSDLCLDLRLKILDAQQGRVVGDPVYNTEGIRKITVLNELSVEDVGDYQSNSLWESDV